jgi:hypothetical protein
LSINGRQSLAPAGKPRPSRGRPGRSLAEADYRHSADCSSYRIELRSQ